MKINKPTISYAITACNEHLELNRLLKQLLLFLENDDEIIIQTDNQTVTDDVVSVISKYIKNNNIKYLEYPLNKDFAKFKNNLFKNCTKDYIFAIDADEYLTDLLLRSLKHFIIQYPDIECFVLPRKNIVYGITNEYATSQNWSLIDIDGEMINCWPDYQKRFFKNHIGIKLKNSVHESLNGHNIETFLPAFDDQNKPIFDYAILHLKSFEKQQQQNKFYETFYRK